jgi:hypothetical protein
LPGSRTTSEPLIATLLRDAGFVGPAAEQARSALEEAKLTRHGKTRIALEKVPRVLDLLSDRFLQYCGSPECLDVLRPLKPGARPVVVPNDHCGACSGSDLQGRAIRIGQALTAAVRIVVVGGSPRVRDQLARLNVPYLELRLVSGLDKRTIDQARADCRWADLVVVLGSSELKHKVSGLYRNRVGEQKVVVVAGRGAGSALSAVETWLARRERM